MVLKELFFTENFFDLFIAENNVVVKELDFNAKVSIFFFYCIEYPAAERIDFNPKV